MAFEVEFEGRADFTAQVLTEEERARLVGAVRASAWECPAEVDGALEVDGWHLRFSVEGTHARVHVLRPVATH